MENIKLSEFILKAEEIVVKWRRFTAALNNLSHMNIRGEQLYKELFGRSPNYELADIEEYRTDLARVFSPELCDSIRMTSAIQLLSHYYTVLPDEENA